MAIFISAIAFPGCERGGGGGGVEKGISKGPLCADTRVVEKKTDVQSLGAGSRAVEDGVASVKGEGVLHLVGSRLGVRVSLTCSAT